MKRGEIWIVAGGSAYAAKPRPAVIVQDDRFDANDSIVVCPLTTDPTPASIFRLPIQPSTRSGLRSPCRMMVDKLTAVPRMRPPGARLDLKPEDWRRGRVGRHRAHDDRVVGVEAVVLNDDRRSRLTRIGGAASDGPHLATFHSASQAEIASTNSWSPAAWALFATASD